MNGKKIIKIIKIFINGLILLIFATILNFLASFLNLESWYTFLVVGAKLNFIDIIWLFMIYPLGLGLVARFLLVDNS